jgi:uncharacterized membrane protein YczE
VLRRILLPLPSDRRPERFARCVGGLAMFGLGITLFIAARLGVAPWDALHLGLSDLSGIPTGIVIEITGVFVLLLWLPLRQRLGWGTLLNAIEIGLVVLILEPILPQPEHMILRIAYMVAGLASVGFGSAAYIGAGLGAGPRDGLMLGLAQRGISVRLARTAIEITVLLAGWALGGTIGIGTAVFTFGIGPVVQFFLPRLRLPDLGAAEAALSTGSATA